MLGAGIWHPPGTPAEGVGAGRGDGHRVGQPLLGGYLPARLQRGVRAAGAGPGSAFVPYRDLAALDDVLCEVRDCAAGRDNCAYFDGLALPP